jgi:hypothetical protein
MSCKPPATLLTNFLLEGLSTECLQPVVCSKVGLSVRREMFIADIVETHCFTLRHKRKRPIVQHSISAHEWSAVHLCPSSRRVSLPCHGACRSPRLMGRRVYRLNILGLLYAPEHLYLATAASRHVSDGIDLDTLRAEFTRFFIGNNNHDLDMVKRRQAEAGLMPLRSTRCSSPTLDLVERLKHGAELRLLRAKATAAVGRRA